MPKHLFPFSKIIYFLKKSEISRFGNVSMSYGFFNAAYGFFNAAIFKNMWSHGNQVDSLEDH